ncbi:MAG: carbamoyltransferase HypF [Spirochaetes bacterium]|nr:MAG: carbamoyltransferase HypF [Spirochaetota bacterium]
MIRKELTITGIVQGVGFRPFIYRLAHEHGIQGSVRNDTRGVVIAAEGEPGDIEAFIKDIREQAPPLSFIETISISDAAPRGAGGFLIEASTAATERSAFIAPDTMVCADCMREFSDPHDRRHHYPFITCTNCGPRFSIIADIPYDRGNTSMSPFTMCAECAKEYADPADRRFHTQPDACPRCGPSLKLMNRKGEVLAADTESVARETLAALEHGAIVAIKGVGGYLLACDAGNDDAVGLLRARKGRPFKPFALMAGSIDSIESFLYVSPAERALLLSKERPIVVLKTREPRVSGLVAPGLSDIGIMLPYAPFQHLLFEYNPGMVLVMTSGNVSDEPIVFREDDARERLGHIADLFVSYNRDIVEFSDDSVLFVQDEIPYFIRRSRGYVPVPFRAAESKKSMLATGGDLKNSFAIARGGVVVLSQFVGDLATLAGNELYRSTIAHLSRVYAFSPDVVVSDLHPGYFTSQFADSLEEKGIPRLKTQHHHAHIASVLEDSGSDTPVIGIAFDGTGYGTDGRLWGSEFMIADKGTFTRMAHFSYFPLPGGESAIRDVWKIGVALEYGARGREWTLGKRGARAEMVIEIIDKNINSPLACSIGRLFDGMASMLGIADRISTEAEAAQLIEEAALRGSRSGGDDGYTVPIAEGEVMELSTDELVRYCATLLGRGMHVDEIAYRFHAAIVRSSLAIAGRLRERTGISTAALSGGAFQNRLLLGMTMRGLRKNKFDILVPRKIPFNDGCLALGQIAIARESIR